MSGERIDGPEDRADAERVYGWRCTLLTAPIARGSVAILWIMVGFGLVGEGMSVAAGRWGLAVFFLVFVAIELAVLLGRRRRERRAWSSLEATALANGWVIPQDLVDAMGSVVPDG
jgi:membrane protein implicated in regulation of membrane protease activity